MTQQNKPPRPQRTPRSPFKLPPRRLPPNPQKLVTMAATLAVGSPERNLTLALHSLACPTRQSLMQMPLRSLSRASRVILRSSR
jgi:hypothetical protein